MEEKKLYRWYVELVLRGRKYSTYGTIYHRSNEFKFTEKLINEIKKEMGGERNPSTIIQILFCQLIQN